MTNYNEKYRLKKVSYIKYLILFKKGHKQIKALFDNNSKLNTMNLDYTQKLGLLI